MQGELAAACVFAGTIDKIDISIQLRFEKVNMDGQDGVYCSTAGAYFQERQSLHEHYQSEFHRRV
jgi:hypothetical protein